jgi:hypothetical protein
LSQEAKEHIDNLAGGTSFLLKTQETRALVEKITASERESEEYDAKEGDGGAEGDGGGPEGSGGTEGGGSMNSDENGSK